MTTRDEDWWMYVLICADGTLYAGITNDLKKRIETHNRGKGSKYVRSRLPATLGVAWNYGKSKIPAAMSEAAFKKLSRAQKLELLDTPGRWEGPDGHRPEWIKEVP